MRIEGTLAAVRMSERDGSRHKADWNNGNRTCTLATHGQDVQHPDDPSADLPYCVANWFYSEKNWLTYIRIVVQENVGVSRIGLNKKNDLEQSAEDENESPNPSQKCRKII